MHISENLSSFYSIFDPICKWSIIYFNFTPFNFISHLMVSLLPSFLASFPPSVSLFLFSFIFLYFSFSLSSSIAEMPVSAISFHETHLASSFSALPLSPASHSDLLSHVQLVIHLVSHKHSHDTEKGPLSKNIYL